MTAARTALIVGGGIGGLSSAIALRRIGVEVDVVEANPRWDVYGVGIIQPGNAIRALAMLGLARQCVDEGFPMAGTREHDRNGVMLSDIDFQRPAGVDFPMMNGITRPRLHRIFTSAALASGSAVRTGVTVSALEAKGGSVQAAFTDGSSGTYDLVVGADGIHSTVRRMVFGDAPEPQLTGQRVWRYNLPRYPRLERLWMFHGSHGRAGFVPLAADLMYLLLVEKIPETDPARLPDDELAERFRKRLAGFGGPVAEVREQIVDPAQVVVRPVEAILFRHPGIAAACS